MRIVHIATVDRVGGAARAARRQHLALRRIGEDSSMFVLIHKDAPVSHVRSYDYRTSLSARIVRRIRKEWYAYEQHRYLRNGHGKEGIFSEGRVHLTTLPVDQIGETDVVNLHWVSGFIDFSCIFKHLIVQKPVVWTLHDMNAFTGGCHYSGDCESFKTHCGNCGQLYHPHENDLSHRAWSRKYKVLQGVDHNLIRIVTPSHWLAQLASKSSLFHNFKIDTIPYCLDTDVFSPGNRHQARKELEITHNGMILIFVASGVDAKRKGLEYLLQALQQLDVLQRPALMTVGRGNPAIQAGIMHFHFEGTTEPAKLAVLYRAADALIAPSLEDNLPLTVQEALACGTPVIAFNTGGIPEMVKSECSGLLVERYDVEGLRDSIERLIRDSNLRKKMARGARLLAKEQFSEQANAKAYQRIYQEMIRVN